MNYQSYEMARALLEPWRFQAKLVGQVLDNPLVPLAHTHLGRTVSAACEVFEGVTRRYGKPEWGIDSTRMGGLAVPVAEQVVWRSPFCELRHFDRDEKVCGKRYDPKVLLVAPMSGHYATLLRGTVQAMLPDHNLYVTDWIDARHVPVFAGRFDLDDFIEHVIEMVRFIGHNTHVIAVCQPSVPVLAATALMAAMSDSCRPASITLMGGPIDTRKNPTQVNQHAQSKDIGWFERNVISAVPWPNAGCMRLVYPGFIQLSGFMTMNLDRHVQAHRGLFDSLVKGDCDSALQHRKFYDEYLAVMDLPAEFFLQTVRSVFQDHDLPDGHLTWRGEKVDCAAIEDTVLMTVEGERDDICGLGQTEAAHELCRNLSADQHVHYVQKGVGHYGVFNGTRWRTEIQPRIREMIRGVNFQRLRAAAE